MILEEMIGCDEIKKTNTHKGHFLHWCCNFFGVALAVVTSILLHNSKSVDSNLKIPLIGLIMISAPTAGKEQLPDVANVDIYDNSTAGQVSSDIDEA